MIGHPSHSGLQMDQVTQLYIPAFFVNKLRLWQDDSPVLAKKFDVRPVGWERHAATWHTVADVDSKETMAEARQVKREMKAKHGA